MDAESFGFSLRHALKAHALGGKLPRHLVEALLRGLVEERLQVHVGLVIQDLEGEQGVDLERFVRWVCSPGEMRPEELVATSSLAMSSKQKFARAALNLKKVQCLRTKEQSMLLGVSIAFLSHDFLEEVEYHFGAAADPNYHELNPVMFHGSKARGYGLACPRDGQQGCSYADALEARHVGPATVMLSWTWQYTAKTVVTALARWCRRQGRREEETFVWQCALCNNQFRVAEKKAKEEDEDFQTFRSVFESRVHSTGHILALLSPWHGPMYTTRIWCVFELWVACEHQHVQLEVILSESAEVDFHQALSADGVVSVWKALGKVQIQKAKASVAADRQHIMRLVEPDARKEEDFESSERVNKLNQVVVQRLQRWCAEAAAQFAESCLEENLAVDFKACANTSWLLMEANDWQRAMALLIQGRQALARLGKQGSLEDAWLLKCTGNWYIDLGNYEKGMEQFGLAKLAMEAAGATASLDYARLLRNMGKSLIVQGHVEDALKTLELAQRTFIEVQATRTANYAVCLRSLGFCCGELGHLDQAMEHYAEAKAIFEATSSTNTPSYAGLLTDMGRIRLTERELMEAMELFQQSVHAFKMAGAECSKSFADLLHFMGDCLDEQGDAHEALRYFRESQSTFQKCKLGQTTNYAALLANMADCMEGLGSLQEATALREEARAIYQAAHVSAEILENMSPLERRRKRVKSPQKTQPSLHFHLD